MPQETIRYSSQPESKESQPDFRTAIIYAGQGQNLKELCSNIKKLAQNPVAREVFDEADEILSDEFPSRFKNGFSPIILEGSENSLRKNQQVLVLLYNFACTRVLKQQKGENGFIFPPKSNIVAISGQSLGLINAIVESGAMDFPNMLRLGVERQDAMQEANEKNPGTLVALIANPSEEKVKELIQDCKLEMSIMTGSNLFVLGGTIDAVKEAIKKAKAKKIRIVPLGTDGAFHTSLMAPAAEQLKKKLLSIEITNPQIPVIVNTTGKFIRTSRRLKEEIIKQLPNSVLWLQSTNSMSKRADQFIEIGNDGLLTGHIKREIENSTGENNSLVKRLLQASGVAIDAIGAALVIRQPLKGSPL